jgi:putative cell wall-binding protein/Tol biopolymer transport system component
MTLMFGTPRRTFSRSAARVLLAVVFALGVVAGPAGAIAVTPTTMYSPLIPERVSVSSTGEQGDSWSGVPAISDDGRYVAFESRATNFSSDDTNGSGRDVYMRDRVSKETTMVSPTLEGTVYDDRGSRSPTISDDGRYVCFVSGKDFVPEDTNGGDHWSGDGIDVYVRDMATGEFNYCDLVGDGSDIGDGELSAMISGNGEYVVVGTHYSIAPEDENSGYRDVYRYDLGSGETTLVSPASTEMDYWDYGAKPVGISDDGRYVAFITRRSIDENDDNAGGYDYYRKDLQTGEIDFVALNGGTTSADANWPEDGEVMLSGDGQTLAFEIDEGLVPEDTNGGDDGEKDVYLYDFATEEFMLVSPVLVGMDHPNRGARSAAINDDASRVVFFTGRDYDSEDVNYDQDLYWYDVEADMYHYMAMPPYAMIMGPTDVSPAVESPGDDVDRIFLSGDGSMVAFDSGTMFMASDTNFSDDVFVRPLELDLTDGDFRLAGADRYETSVQISQEAFPNGSDAVIIATGANWPDALCGSALSGAVDAPILLAAPGGLTTAVKAEITRLGAVDAYILGNEKAVSVAIEQVLDDMLSGYVDRLAGRDRYWTAKAITNKVIELRPSAYDGTALVTTGGNYADAMAAAPLSAALAWPILLENPLSHSVYAPADLSHAIILGGKTAVSQTAENYLVSLIGAGDVERLAGANRYETAAMIAQYGVDSGMHWNGVGVASGVNFPDALAGGASLGRLGAVVLLTPPAALAPAAASKLEDNAADITTVYILGGPTAVSPAVKAEVLSILGM